ncbi:VOC family protein [Shewanella frigidimarina]|uniref:VOC family protein n=1 Tax=Shewanella frigidimarina TaxID=56812 RepID=UPI003D7AA9CB
MFSHIMLGANDIEKSKAFYDATLGELGIKPGVIDPKGRCFYMTSTGIFALSKPLNGEPACNGNGSTIGFHADNAEQANAWHAAGVVSGGEACEDDPGVRDSPNGPLYLAYLRDPSGNKVCVLHRPKA